MRYSFQAILIAIFLPSMLCGAGDKYGKSTFRGDFKTHVGPIDALRIKTLMQKYLKQPEGFAENALTQLSAMQTARGERIDAVGFIVATPEQKSETERTVLCSDQQWLLFEGVNVEPDSCVADKMHYGDVQFDVDGFDAGNKPEYRVDQFLFSAHNEGQRLWSPRTGDFLDRTSETQLRIPHVYSIKALQSAYALSHGVFSRMGVNPVEFCNGSIPAILALTHRKEPEGMMFISTRRIKDALMAALAQSAAAARGVARGSGPEAAE